MNKSFLRNNTHYWGKIDVAERKCHWGKIRIFGKNIQYTHGEEKEGEIEDKKDNSGGYIFRSSKGLYSRWQCAAN